MYKIILVAIFLFCMSSNDAKAHEFNPSIADEFGIEFAENYLLASFANDKFWEVLGENDFPEYYGGHFFCQKGKFHFKVTDTSLAEEGIFAEFIEDENVIIVTVEFSHSDLTNVMKEIEKYVQDNPSCVLKIASWGIDQCNNTVVVNLLDFSDEMEAIFKQKVTDSGAITLVQGENVKTLVPRALSEMSDSFNNLAPGTRIYIGKFAFSAGYPAIRNDQPGFVTALHGLPLTDEYVRIHSPTGQIIGSVTSPIKFQNSADGAFIALVDATFSHEVDKKNLVNSQNRPAQGMILTSVSALQNGESHIQRNIVVTNPHFSANFGDGLVLSDLVQTNGTAMYGESGGIVVRPISDTAEIMGVIVGSNSETDQNMFFAWSENVDRALGVVLD